MSWLFAYVGRTRCACYLTIRILISMTTVGRLMRYLSSIIICLSLAVEQGILTRNTPPLSRVNNDEGEFYRRVVYMYGEGNLVKWLLIIWHIESEFSENDTNQTVWLQALFDCKPSYIRIYVGWNFDVLANDIIATWQYIILWWWW